MTREDMLARLIAQAGHEGGELITLRAIVEEASELGANRVLDRLGVGGVSFAAGEAPSVALIEIREAA